MAQSLLPDIEISWGWGKSPAPPPSGRVEGAKIKPAPLPEKKGKSAFTKTSIEVCKKTGKVIKRTTMIWPIKFGLAILDLLAAPFGSMAGKDINFPLLWKVGCAMILCSFWLFVAVDRNIHGLLGDIGFRASSIAFLALIAKTVFPGMVGLAGICMVVGGIRLQQGKSFSEKLGRELEPLPAFESGVVFKIGDVKLSLRDMHTGVGAFGGIGSGKICVSSSAVTTYEGGREVGTTLKTLKIGDKIKTPKGFEIVQKIHEFENWDFWKIETISGRKTFCGMEHLWWFKIAGEDGETIAETKVINQLLRSGKEILIPIFQENSPLTWERIIPITFHTKGEGRCLVLSGTDHLYVTDDNIITHNCLDPEQDVLMYDGRIKKVKTVIEGDLLMGPDGKARRVMVTNTGYGPLYRITPIKGSGKPWICNDIHVMTLRYTNQGGSRPNRKTPNGVEEKDHWNRRKHYKGISQVFGNVPDKRVGRYFQKVLEEKDFIMDVPLKDFLKRKAPSRPLDLFWKLFRPPGIEFPDLEEHDPSRYKYTHAAINAEEFYLAGAWIGDGYVANTQWYNMDNSILQSIRSYGIKEDREIKERSYGSKNPNYRVIWLTGNGKKSPLESWLLEFTSASLEQKSGCGGTLSGLYSRHGGQYDKDIPHWALVAPREKRLALLAGMLDTDGSLQQVGRCFDFTQKRKHIVEKTVWLCRSLGLAAAEPYESWKECTNRTQTLPTIKDLRDHPILLQQLAERALLKLKLQQRERKISQEEFDRLQSIFTRLGASGNTTHNPSQDGHARFAGIKKESGRYAVKAAGLIETIKTLYFIRTGKNPRKEAISKYVQSNDEFATLIAEVKEKCGLEGAQSDAESWLETNEWEKLHIRIEGAALTEDKELSFDTESLHELLAFHQSEPRERYWRTNISGDIEMIPTRVPHKQVVGTRPDKRADGRDFEHIEDRNSKDPLCFGWDAEPIGDGPYCGFTLDGDGRFLLGDFTVTHNTVSMMVPLMRQFFRQLNRPDDNDEFARCGALILDEKGDFIDSTITEMLLAGRSLQDLVLIDPDLDLYRYNPLDPQQSADENAAKLAKVQKILGTSSGGDNAYWDQTSQATIKGFLQLLEVYKPKNKIGMDDIARFMRDDDLATILCDEVEKTINEKKLNNEISEDAYGAYTDAISSTRNAWINLNQNTKSTLKTTITNMLGPIAQNPRLQKVFCRDTNFSFSDLPNKGKIVLFRGSGIDKATARLICVCLKIDFQTWQKRRNGSSASTFGLNTIRTVLFICDEYQEFVTCGGEGDETFYGVSRSTRTAPIVATQSYNSLETAIKNKEQTKTLRQNIATWVFFRSTDQDTCELGKFLAGQSKKEDFSTSVNQDSFMASAANLGSHSGKENTVNVSRKLEENFRTDDFSRLVTMTMEKSRSGPWYSEAIVYHYHDIDESAESRCYKTRLTHLYYDKALGDKARKNVNHLDWILLDRNWQRKAQQRGLLLVQRAEKASAEIKQLDLLRRESQATMDGEKKKADESPQVQAEKRAINNLLEKTRAESEAAKAGLGEPDGLPGAINTSEEGGTEEETLARIKSLENALETADEKAVDRILIRIDEEKKTLAKLKITANLNGDPPKKEVLRASGVLPGENEEEPEVGEGDPGLEILASASDETGDEEEDDLWKMEIPGGPAEPVISQEEEISALQIPQQEPEAILPTGAAVAAAIVNAEAEGELGGENQGEDEPKTPDSAEESPAATEEVDPLLEEIPEAQNTGEEPEIIEPQGGGVSDWDVNDDDGDGDDTK